MSTADDCTHSRHYQWNVLSLEKHVFSLIDTFSFSTFTSWLCKNLFIDKVKCKVFSLLQNKFVVARLTGKVWIYVTATGWLGGPGDCNSIGMWNFLGCFKQYFQTGKDGNLCRVVHMAWHSSLHLPTCKSKISGTKIFRKIWLPALKHVVVFTQIIYTEDHTLHYQWLWHLV